MRFDHRVFSGMLLLILFMGFSLALTAQVNTVELTVHVLDPKDAAVPGAEIRMRNLSTGAMRDGQSDNSGRYLFVGLAPGRYELTIEAKGFAKLVSPEIVLTIGQAGDFHLELRIGRESILEGIVRLSGGELSVDRLIALG